MNLNDNILWEISRNVLGTLGTLAITQTNMEIFHVPPIKGRQILYIWNQFWDNIETIKSKLIYPCNMNFYLLQLGSSMDGHIG